ncbi:MAG: PDZ domain-containing protein [Fibrobacteria bacterium]|nr:PDZ domain-containing protein [Fibrobacteria bacterium]
MTAFWLIQKINGLSLGKDHHTFLSYFQVMPIAFLVRTSLQVLKLCFIGLCCCLPSFLSNCASQTGKAPSEKISGPPKGSIQRTVLGLSVVKNENKQIEIHKINGNAKKAGLKKRDILLTLDDCSVKERIDIISCLEDLTPEDSIVITVRRGTDSLRMKAVLGLEYYRIDLDDLGRILWQEDTVNMVIVTGNFSNSSISSEVELEEWRKGRSAQALAGTENFFINAFKYEEAFSIVDRSKVETILEEQSFQESDVFSDSVRSHLEGTLGATHILFVEGARIGNQYIRTHRLVDVSKGKVISSVVFESKKEKLFGFINLSLFSKRKLLS